MIALTAAAVGCSYVNPPAMVVTSPNGASTYTLSDAQLQQQLTTIAGNTSLVSAFVGQSVSPYTNEAKTVYNPAFVTGVLTVQVQLFAVVEDAARRGITPTAEEKQTATETVAKQLAGGASDPTQSGAVLTTDGNATLDALGPFKDVLVSYVAVQPAFEKSVTPTEEELRKVYDGAKDRLPPSACASHILITASTAAPDPTTGQPAKATDAEYAAALAKATDLEAQLAAGADFATLAKANPGDPTSAANGGALACVSKRGSYVQEFDDAVWNQPVGVVGPPVKTQFGYHIIKVTKRGTPSFDEVKDQIVKALSSDAVSKAQQAAVASVQVKVDPRYGSWDASKGQVVAPNGASNPTQPSTTLDIGSVLGQGSPTGSAGSAGSTDPSATVDPAAIDPATATDPASQAGTSSGAATDPASQARTGSGSAAGSTTTAPSASGSTTTTNSATSATTGPATTTSSSPARPTTTIAPG